MPELWRTRRTSPALVDGSAPRKNTYTAGKNHGFGALGALGALDTHLPHMRAEKNFRAACGCGRDVRTRTHMGVGAPFVRQVRQVRKPAGQRLCRSLLECAMWRTAVRQKCATRQENP